MVVVCSNPACQTSAGCQCNKPEWWQYTSIPSYTTGHTNIQNKGWECPKCGRVYAPCVTECRSCNSVAGNQWGPATSVGK